ncbi:MAG: hypothetical protein ACKO4Y_01855 [Flavobacteriales bacterium]
MRISFIMLCFVSVLLGSCSGYNKRISLEDTETPNSQNESIAFAEQQSYDSLIKAIDSEKDLDKAMSLEYEDAGMNHSVVTAYLTKSNDVVKLILDESANDGKMIKTEFYFTGKDIFFARQHINDYQKERNGFGEIFSYFGANKKVIYTASKLGNSEDELNQTVATRTKKTSFDPTKALQIINQKGPFETRYQGHIETDIYTFIIVGTGGKTGQKSAIAYNNNFPLAEAMVKQNNQFINKKLRVEFTKVTEMNNFSYQGLTGIKLINEK